MDIWSRSAPALDERRVYIGGLICSFGISAILFGRGAWKGGLFVGLWAPPIFRLADLLRERIEG